MTKGHIDHAEHASDARHGHGAHPEGGPGYETKDASVRGLLLFGAGLIIALVLVQLVMLGFLRVFEMERPSPKKTTAQENLYQQLRDLHRHEDEALSSYKADPKTGTVRIPIERAMELVAEKGSPFGKGPKTELEVISHAGSPVPADGKDAPKPPDDEKKKVENPPASKGSKP
jgi:hypothetical protein